MEERPPQPRFPHIGDKDFPDPGDEEDQFYGNRKTSPFNPYHEQKINYQPNDDALDQHNEMREQMEKPIKLRVEAPEMPSHFAPTFRRASARSSMNRALREQRWASYADIDGA